MRSNKHDEFEKTQKLDKLDETIIQQPKRSDIEIQDVESKNQNKKDGKNTKKISKFLHSKRFKISVLAVVFIAALAGGFYLSSYYHEQKDLAENETLHNQQEIKKQQQSLEDERRRLEDERRQLEHEKESMHSSGSGGSGSWLGSAIDSLTGSSSPRRTQSSEDTTQIDNKINQAQQKIDELNDSMGKLGTLKGKAMQVQGQISQAYYDNKGLIDSIKYHIESFLQ